MADRPRIVVLGSINMDLVATAPALPRSGQTVIGESFATAPGGKGANQAVAAARLGADVRMIGRVGDDLFGPMLLASLEGYGVNVE
ncbi:MAG: ribokinase, partial [Chloroflexi bacterium]|nr:ribokinase [Chloroflexota bacterium]